MHESRGLCRPSGVPKRAGSPVFGLSSLSLVSSQSSRYFIGGIVRARQELPLALDLSWVQRLELMNLTCVEYVHIPCMLLCCSSHL